MNGIIITCIMCLLFSLDIPIKFRRVLCIHNIYYIYCFLAKHRDTYYDMVSYNSIILDTCKISTIIQIVLNFKCTCINTHKIMYN